MLQCQNAIKRISLAKEEVRLSISVVVALDVPTKSANLEKVRIMFWFDTWPISRKAGIYNWTNDILKLFTACWGKPPLKRTCPKGWYCSGIVGGCRKCPERPNNIRACITNKGLLILKLNCLIK